MNNFKKTDLLSALIIGEICAWLMVLVAGNLAMEIPAVAEVKPYLNYLPVIFPLLCAAGLVAAYFLSGLIPVLRQLAKFILVGGLNFLIDMGVLNFLIFYTGVATGFIQSGFKGISFLLAVFNSYLWNKYWVFKRTTEESKTKEFLQFFIVSAVGFCVNLGIDYVVVNLINPFGGMSEKTWAQFGALAAAVIALSWNFLGYKFIVFEQKNEQ